VGKKSLDYSEVRLGLVDGNISMPSDSLVPNDGDGFEDQCNSANHSRMLCRIDEWMGDARTSVLGSKILFDNVGLNYILHMLEEGPYSAHSVFDKTSRPSSCFKLSEVVIIDKLSDDCYDAFSRDTKANITFLINPCKFFF